MLLMEQTGKTLPWGTLTGIRPTKIAMTKLAEGDTPEQVFRYMKQTYFTSNEKINLCIEIAQREEKLLSAIDYRNGYSLYIGIPFCPTTCLYCSFTSYPIGRWQGSGGEKERLYAGYGLFWRWHTDVSVTGGLGHHDHEAEKYL